MNNDWIAKLNQGDFSAFGRVNAQATPYQMRQVQPQTQEPKKQKSFWEDQISTGGGIAGALAGAAGGAALGSVVPVVGTTIGGLLGAILGGAAGSGGGQIAENAITGQDDIWEGVGQEALLGGVFSAPPIRLARGLAGAGGALRAGAGSEGARGALEAALTRPGLLSRGARSAERVGEGLLTAQANIPRGMARQLGLPQAMSALNRYGLRSLDEISEITPKITGESGLMSGAVRKAVGSSRGVDTTGFRDIGTALIENEGVLLSQSVRNNITRDIKNILVKASGGSRGSINPRANALDVFDTIKTIEKKAASIGRGKPAALLSADESATKSIYRLLADELKDRLFSSEGIEAALPAIKESVAKSLDTLATQTGRNGLRTLAREVRSATDIGQLRSLQAPFVRASQAASETALSQGTAGTGIAQGARGLGRLGNPLRLAEPILETANAPVGGALIRGGQALGRSLANRGNTPVQQATGGILPLAARQSVVAPAVSGMIRPTESTPMESGQQLDQQFGPQLGQQLGSQGIGAQGIGAQTSPYPRENLMYDIQRDPANAQAYIQYYQQINEIFSPQTGADLSAAAQKTLTASSNAENALQQMEQTLLSAGGGTGKLRGGLTNLAGNIGLNDSAAVYNDMVQAYVPTILQALGKTDAPSETELKGILKSMPQIDDTPGVVQQKLADLRAQIAAVKQNAMLYGGGNTPGSLQDALLQAQGVF